MGRNISSWTANVVSHDKIWKTWPPYLHLVSYCDNWEGDCFYYKTSSAGRVSCVSREKKCTCPGRSTATLQSQKEKAGYKQRSLILGILFNMDSVCNILDDGK